MFNRFTLRGYPPIRRQFFYWIVSGVVIVFYYYFGPYTVCQPEVQNSLVTESYQQSSEGQQHAKPVHHSVTLKKVDPEKKNKNAEYSNTEISSPINVCSDTKFSDVALVFFTYCLVIVGWFAMRNTDETTKRERRAYVVAGPLYGIANKWDGNSDWIRTNRALAEMFHGPYRLALMNFGQTAGFTTKVEWGICKREEFMDDVRVSDIVRKRKYSQWWCQHQEKEMGSPILIQDILEPGGNNAKHYRHVEYPDRDALIGSVLFGKITYKDVFRDEHWTTFAYYIREDHTDSLPKSLSDDHS